MSAELPSIRSARKDDHVRLASSQHRPLARNEFDDVEFVHHALGGIDVAAVSLGVSVDRWEWQTPFYINGMTGGSDRTAAINRELAVAARELRVPMASGSISVALDAPNDHGIVRSFTVIRDENPDGFVMANLGIGRPLHDAVRAVELLQADALQIHLNAVQEIAMPEGSRDFSRWLGSLEALASASPVPVIVKEVGFGLSRRTLEVLAQLGVRVADVSGRGGTDFLTIENARHANDDTDLSMLSGFGQSAMACLLDAPSNDVTLLASGGVRTPFDVVKALAAGASAVGVAGVFLEAARRGGAAALVPLMQQWLDHTRAIMALLGAAKTSELATTDLLIRGRLAEYCQLRGIDLPSLARRSSVLHGATSA